jgi:hypothetical protein
LIFTCDKNPVVVPVLSAFVGKHVKNEAEEFKTRHPLLKGYYQAVIFLDKKQ